MRTIKRHAVDRELAEEMPATERELSRHGIEIMMTKSETRPLAPAIHHAVWIAGLVAALDGDDAQLCRSLARGDWSV